MPFKKFRATQLFDGYRLKDDNHVLIATDEGTIEAVVLVEDAGDDVQPLKGILCPGFINCHCHVELSHLKNVIPPHTGLINFLCEVVGKRNFPAAIIQAAIEQAEREMYANGIVAVGDISNTADTALMKSKSRIRWQNFVEVLSFTDEKAVANIQHYLSVLQNFEAHNAPHKYNRTNLVPHAAYTVSTTTFQLINEATPQCIISIHNQEHPAEDELYKKGGGAFLQLFNQLGIASSPFEVTGKSSIQSYLPHFNQQQTIFLVHNTYMPTEDIRFANHYAAKQKLHLVYCLCPNANVYIENTLPPVAQLIAAGCHVVLGTDSYSSNWQLSIAKEIQAVVEMKNGVPLETALQMATLNGAKALRWQESLGSFEKGKTPGIVLLQNNLEKSERIL
jgi:aminodeoxyfutalosine deaminase